MSLTCSQENTGHLSSKLRPSTKSAFPAHSREKNLTVSVVKHRFLSSRVYQLGLQSGRFVFGDVPCEASHQPLTVRGCNRFTSRTSVKLRDSGMP